MITIYNPGEYASYYSPEEYINNNIESEIRNEKIVKVLYTDKSIEQFGSGSNESIAYVVMPSSDIHMKTAETVLSLFCIGHNFKVTTMSFPVSLWMSL